METQVLQSQTVRRCDRSPSRSAEAIALLGFRQVGLELLGVPAPLEFANIGPVHVLVLATRFAVFGILCGRPMRSRLFALCAFSSSSDGAGQNSDRRYQRSANEFVAPHVVTKESDKKANLAASTPVI